MKHQRDPTGSVFTMPSIENLSATDIDQFDYNQLISIVRETNRPPGGAETVWRIARRACLTDSSRILEIGTSTGFTAIELSTLFGCQIDAIDINDASLLEAERRARRDDVDGLVRFRQASATSLPFGDNEFDLVFCGNVTSLIPDKDAALSEYVRVLRPNGFLAATPMYYLQPPSTVLLRDVSAALQIAVEVYDKSHWKQFFEQTPLALYWEEDFRFDYQPDAIINAFGDRILSSTHLAAMNQDARRKLGEKYREYLKLFRDNLAMMGFSSFLLRKELSPIDPQLFTATRLLTTQDDE